MRFEANAIGWQGETKLAGLGAAGGGDFFSFIFLSFYPFVELIVVCELGYDRPSGENVARKVWVC